MKYSEFFKLLEKKDHIIKKLTGLTDEQKQIAIDFFTKHPNYESEIDWNRKDLKWDDFEAVIYKERISKSQLSNFVKEGVHYLKLFSDDKIQIYQPLTWIGSRYLASKDVYPYVVGEWCIAYQKNREYWDEYSFGNRVDDEDDEDFGYEDDTLNPNVFLILCTPTSKWAMQVEVDTDIGVFWSDKDENVSESVFLSATREEVPYIEELLNKYVSIAVDNYKLVKKYHERDLKDTKILIELQKKAEQDKIDSFKRNFDRTVAQQGYYVWDGDLSSKELNALGLAHEEGYLVRLDDRIKYLKVTGNYSLRDINISEIVWPMDLKGTFRATGCSKIASAIIPEYVTSIENGAFWRCSGLREVVFPSSLKFIGDEAFAGCSFLTSITIPDSVEVIGSEAFKNCESLISATLPKTIKSMGYGVFKDCSHLKSITLPQGLTRINTYQFKECTSLKSVYIPEGVEVIDAYAFSGCKSLESITFPKSLKGISSHAFYRCKDLKSLVIPDSVDFLGSGAFEECYGLKSLTLSSRLDVIHTYSFAYCSNLENLVIPEGITTIQGAAFDGCSRLTNVWLPSTLKEVEKFAFRTCSKLENVYLNKKRSTLSLGATGLMVADHIYFKGEF